jgi:hypothetical protein
MDYAGNTEIYNTMGGFAFNAGVALDLGVGNRAVLIGLKYGLTTGVMETNDSTDILSSSMLGVFVKFAYITNPYTRRGLR